MRNRLQSLICDKLQTDACMGHCNHPPCYAVECMADYLLENGVIVLPCKVGDKIYQVIGNIISEYKVTQVRFDDIMMWFYCENEEYVKECAHFLFDETRIGRTVFLTRWQAEKALEERRVGQ